MTYRLIDICSGAGGMTLGFTDARYGGGFRSVLAIDNDEPAVASFRHNFGKHAVVDDIENWVADDIALPEADVVVGGLPCTGFSLLNKQRKKDARRALWRPFLELVHKSHAPCFVIENVPELCSSPEYTQLSDCADALGFATISAVLVAADYGTPQLRYRSVIFGYKKHFTPPVPFPPPRTHGFAETDSPPHLPRWRTVRDAISDLPAPIGTDINVRDDALNLHFGRNPTALSKKRYAFVPEGGNRFDLQRRAPDLTPQCWINKTSGGTDLFGRLWWDRPSVTIRTEFFKPEKGRYLHPEANRPITHREAARLMGFPDDFVFDGSKVQIARQIGNAVPPHLAGAISDTVRDFLDRIHLTAAA